MAIDMQIRSHDGSTILLDTTVTNATFTITYAGITNGDITYTYSGDKTFIGISDTPNSVTQYYHRMGVCDLSEFSGDPKQLYIVEAPVIEGCNAWYLKTSVDMSSGTYTSKFASHGKIFNNIIFDDMNYVIKYGDTTAYTDGQGWANQSYRTVIFETRPTGALLTWLQDNATELSYSAEAWYFNTTVSGTIDSECNFISNGTTCNNIDKNSARMIYTPISGGVYIDADGWQGLQYRTIILENDADDEVLTFLANNATRLAETLAVTYTVSFDMQGHGTQVASQIVEDGETATTPYPTPSASGWVFGGWYEEAACTNQFNFSTPITADKTLYAKWTVQTYTVTFNANGHGTAPSSQTVQAGGLVTEPTAPTATGWQFCGWYKATDGITPWNFATDTISGTTTIYAKWAKQIGCSTWLFKPTINPTISTTTVDYVAGNAPYLGFRKDSETFYFTNSGWSSAAYDITTNTWNDDSLRLISFEERPTDTLLDFMQANATEYTSVKEVWYFNSTLSSSFTGSHIYTFFYSDGQLYDEIYITSEGTVQYISNGDTEITTTVYTTTDHWVNDKYRNIAFNGILPSGTPYQFFKTNAIRMATGGPTSVYTITFNMNGHGTQIASQTRASGQTATQPTAPTQTGYTFGGWYTDEQLQSAFSFSTPITANTQLYAKWTINQYTITYTLDGGAVPSPNPTTYTIETPTFTLYNPTKLHYIFSGWTGTDISTATTTVTVTQGSIGNRAYTATWTASPTYTVTFDMGGHGTQVPQQTIYQNEKATQPTTPVADGYLFIGWFNENTYTTLFNFNTPITANKTLYAKWVAQINRVTDPQYTDNNTVTAYRNAFDGGQITTAQTSVSGTTLPLKASVLNTPIDMVGYDAQHTGIQGMHKTNVTDVLDADKAIWFNETSGSEGWVYNLIHTARTTYNASTTYRKNDIVLYNDDGKTYIAKQNVPLGTIPTNTTYWLALSLEGPQGNPWWGVNYKGTWDSGTAYNQFDMVKHMNGRTSEFYVALSGAMPAGTPLTSWYLAITMHESRIESATLEQITSGTLTGTYYVDDGNGNITFYDVKGTTYDALYVYSLMSNILIESNVTSYIPSGTFMNNALSLLSSRNNLY